MNCTIKDATVKRFHYDNHDQLRTHLADVPAAYNFARRPTTRRIAAALGRGDQGVSRLSATAWAKPGEAANWKRHDDHRKRWTSGMVPVGGYR